MCQYGKCMPTASNEIQPTVESCSQMKRAYKVCRTFGASWTRTLTAYPRRM